MLYYIDGYNLIFCLTNSKHPLIHQRKSIALFLQKQFASLNLEGILVFDGSERGFGGSSRAYASPLQIVYSPKGQTADEYILEKLEGRKKNSLSTVVSNDRSLCSHARSLGARTQSNEAFIEYLEKKKARKRKKVPDPKDSPREIERLLKIFEANLEE